MKIHHFIPLCLMAATAHGATILTAGVTVTDDFNSGAPVLADWSTASFGSGNTYANAAALDAAVNTSFDSDLAVNALATTAAYGGGGQARWNSTTEAIFTQPSGNAYTALVAKLVNNTGSTLSSLTLTYDLTSLNGTDETIDGQRVFFSATGDVGTWTTLANVSGVVSGTNLTETISGLNWTNGSTVFLLFADDNNFGGDNTNVLDNVRFNATSVPEPGTALLGGLGLLGLLRRRRA